MGLLLIYLVAIARRSSAAVRYSDASVRPSRRDGWALTTERARRNPKDVVDLPGLIDIIEAEMKDAPDRVQWGIRARPRSGVSTPSIALMPSASASVNAWRYSRITRLPRIAPLP